ncbi:hypothetical protein [Roseibacillus ishigakijimensis]
MRSSFFQLLLVLLWSTVLCPAQNPDPLVFTVGKTFETNNGTTLHNYLLWQPGDAATTFGKRFAIYGKDGAATSANPYQKLGVQTLQTSPSAIQALLTLGGKFDADGARLPEMIVALNAEANGTTLPEGYEFPTSINLEVAQKLAQIMTVAETDAEVLQSLVSLGRAHPGVQMAIGLGWAIETAPNSITTYEVREIDNGDNDLRVVGRVTLDAANPQMLLPPHPAHVLPHPVDPNLQLAASPKDHLAVRLRWGTPNGLRTLLPHTYGFNLYRVEQEAVDAVTGNPSSLSFAEDVLNLGGVKVNMLPIAAHTLMTDGEAANVSFSPDIFFFGDDKNPEFDDPFEDGDSFYYYVAARDIAGHPGPLSTAAAITICDRLPPSMPAIVSVDNVFDLAGSNPGEEKGRQHLRVTIRQVPETPVENRAMKYRVYRWHSAIDWQTHGANPEQNFIGEVNHIEGEPYVTFDDLNPADLDEDGLAGVDTGTPLAENEDDADMGKTYWYTVRAVDGSACTPANLSGHCGAMYGVLRDRVGPPQPEGALISCFCVPRINRWLDPYGATPDSLGLSATAHGFMVLVARIDQSTQTPRVAEKVKSFDLAYHNTETFDPTQQSSASSQIYFTRTYHYQGAELYGAVFVPFPEKKGYRLSVRSRLGDGSTSRWLTVTTDPESTPADRIKVHSFRAEAHKCCPVLISQRVLRDDRGNVRKDINRYLPPDSEDDDCPSWIEVVPGTTPPPFLPVNPDGSIEPVCGQLYLGSEDIREVRIYRRAGNRGKLTLVAQESSQKALPSFYEWKENATLLVNGVTACYYAQTFDEHGNASPLTRLGCVTVVNEDLGVPMLMEPRNLPAVDDRARAELSWFCDPVGVDRFEVWVASEGGSEPSLTAPGLTGRIATSTSPVLESEDGESLSYAVYRTDSLSSGFGDGGEFSLTLTLPAEEKLTFVVRPIGPQIPDPVTGAFEFATGDFSNQVSGQWSEPSPGLQDVIPWPAKPLPGVAEWALPVTNFAAGEGPFYAHPIPPEFMNTLKASAGILIGTVAASPSSKLPDMALLPGDQRPESHLFHYRRQSSGPPTAENLESLMPFVVYRYQVPSERYPEAQPNLVQITPLIDRLSFKSNFPTSHQSDIPISYQVEDPFLFFADYRSQEPAMPVPITGVFTRNPANFTTAAPVFGDNNPAYLSRSASAYPDAKWLDHTIWLRDSHPAARGASYQYLLVPFSERGEIERIIPTNIITHN